MLRGGGRSGDRQRRIVAGIERLADDPRPGGELPDGGGSLRQADKRGDRGYVAGYGRVAISPGAVHVAGSCSMTRSRILSILAALCFGLTSAAAVAQQPDASVLTFDGVARTGADSRAVTLHVFCSPNEGRDVTGALGLDLEIPNQEQLRPVFDFDPFEGPDAHAGALTVLQANGARNKADGRFEAAGSIEDTGGVEIIRAGSGGVAARAKTSGQTRRRAAPVAGWRPVDLDPGQCQSRRRAAGRDVRSPGAAGGPVACGDRALSGYALNLGQEETYERDA